MNYNGYINSNSFIHRMNPSFKFIISIIFIILIFIPYGFITQILLLVIVLAIYFIARLPFKKLFNIVISIFVMMAILFLVNWITYKSPGLVFDFDSKAEDVFNQLGNGKINFGNNITIIEGKYFLQGYLWGGNPINSINVNGNTLILNNGFIQKPSDEIFSSLKTILKNNNWKFVESNGYLYVYQHEWYSLSSYALSLMFYVSLKIFLMILVVTILTTTTSSVELTYALEDILNPLRIFRLPVTVWSTTIALGIRFIPSLLDESDRIMKAQASRGLDFKNGNIKDKIVSLTSFIVPLFSIAFQKADELANAMEARGYNPRFTRTRYREYKISFFDWIVYLFFVIVLGFVISLTLISQLIQKKEIYISPLGLLEAIQMFGI